MQMMSKVPIRAKAAEFHSGGCWAANQFRKRHKGERSARAAAWSGRLPIQASSGPRFGRFQSGNCLLLLPALSAIGSNHGLVLRGAEFAVKGISEFDSNDVGR
jgi:hypothetical protein